MIPTSNSGRVPLRTYYEECFQQAAIHHERLQRLSERLTTGILWWYGGLAGLACFGFGGATALFVVDRVYALPPTVSALWLAGTLLLAGIAGIGWLGYALATRRLERRMDALRDGMDYYSRQVARLARRECASQPSAATRVLDAVDYHQAS